MKKNNAYLADDQINLGVLVKLLWREKILILSISIICGLAGYLYSSFKPQEFRTEIQIKKPPFQLFEPYYYILNNKYSIDNTVEEFISDFKSYFLSLDNLQSFVDESREFDNFKEYLKSINISAKNYFNNKIGQVKNNNLIIPNKYFIVFKKELDGDIFFYNYAQFIKKKTVFNTKKFLKLSIENKIFTLENALVKAKLSNLEYPILMSSGHISLPANKPEDLFYRGTKILSQDIINLKKLLIKLESDQFDFEITLDKPSSYPINKISNLIYIAAGLMFGVFFSFVIIFFKSVLKNN